MGYGEAQMKDLEATINASDVDLVIIGTPIDLTRVIKINKPSPARALRTAGDRPAHAGRHPQGEVREEEIER